MSYIAQNREEGGKLIRDLWIEFSRTRPDCKDSWLVPWDEMNNPLDKEVDRYIWEHIVAPYVAAIASLHKQIDQMDKSYDRLYEKCLELARNQ